MNLRVSIIIPVYNVEQYIEECLQSVANQTAGDLIECIIVDDKGTDESIKVAEAFIESYHGDVKFNIIYREENGGLSAARNTGIRAAQGEYLYFLDSDDYIIPTCIETLLTLADKHGGVDLLPALYIRESNDMQQFSRESFPEFSDDHRLIKRSLLDYDKIPVTAANRLIRRQMVIDNNLWFKEGIIHEDNYWTFFLAKHVKRMAFSAEKLYFYRETTGSITKKPNIEKEALAYKAIIEDSCCNIDSFESGAQKKFILLHLLTMRANQYYSTEKEYNNLRKQFSTYNSIAEKILLFIIFHASSHGLFYRKTVNLIQRLYLS